MTDLILKTTPRHGLGYSNTMESPPVLYAEASRVFGPFDLDACASYANHLAPAYFTEDVSCLPREWGPDLDGKPQRAYCNPPYGEDFIGDIVRKALEEALAGRCSTLLIFPSKKSQFPWWAEAVVGVNGPGATGIITASGQGTRGRIDFHRDGVPLGNPNHASVLVWFQAGLVDATTREHHRLPWTGTLWLPGYAVWLPDWARRLV